MAEDAGTDRMHRALDAVRREGYTVAVIYAVVDAAVVALAVNLLLQLVALPVVPETVSLPGFLVTAFGAIGVEMTNPALSGGAVVGLLAGLATAAVEVAVRTRRPLVEQFEAANPSVREALRTARDAVEDDRDNRIVHALYDDVLERLQETSSAGLVDLRRVSVTVVVVIALGVLSVQVAAMDLSLLGFDDGPETTGPDQSSEYTGLQDPDAILGDSENVSAGEDELEAAIGTSGGGEGNASDVPRAYDTGGLATGGAVESQQAGFAAGEQLEEAALIREYNLRIRGETDE